MEFANTWESMAGQGLMFWSATGAVALGVALILSSIFIKVRRLRARAVRMTSTAPADRVMPIEKVESIAETPLDRENRGESRNTPAESQPRSEEPNNLELRLLLARLRSAVDRLEDFRGSDRGFPVESAESSLKASRDGVDYLFRTGTG